MNTTRTTTNPAILANNLMDVADEATNVGQHDLAGRLYDAAERIIDLSDGKLPSTVNHDELEAIYAAHISGDEFIGEAVIGQTAKRLSWGRHARLGRGMARNAWVSTSSGTYVGVIASEWDGSPVHGFIDGEINGTKQGCFTCPAPGEALTDTRTMRDFAPRRVNGATVQSLPVGTISNPRYREQS